MLYDLLELLLGPLLTKQEQKMPKCRTCKKRMEQIGPPRLFLLPVYSDGGTPPARTTLRNTASPSSGRRRSPPPAGPAAFGGSGAPCTAHSACLFRTSCGYGRTRPWRAHISMSIRSLPGCCSSSPETARRRRPRRMESAVCDTSDFVEE